MPWDEVTYDDPGELIEWLEDQTWSDFAMSLVEFYNETGFLTDNQIEAAESMREKIEAREWDR